jgi:hypothetical protein
MHTLSKLSVVALLAIGAGASQAADWSDTSIGYRFGNKYAEPFNTSDIKKNIFNLTHASGYKYGSNFFNVDLLMSDKKDASAFGSTDGAQEVYIVYRNTVDLAKIGGPDIKFPGVRGSGLTLGFDANTKTDVGYNSKKRMLVVGPTLFVDVPGFLNVSLLLLDESNQPSGTTFATTPSSRYSVSRYAYKTHAMLTAAWGIPLSSTVPVSFEGFMNFIGSKGVNEFGGATKPETNIDAQVMLDVGALSGGAKGTFKVGIEYQYWKNKFGNPASGPAGSGAFAKTPMLRAEYHF